MRLYQTWKNYAVQLGLEVPVLRRFVRWSIVRHHVNVFVEWSERDGERRRRHLEALFDASMDVYERALAEGYPEAEAREITHIQASFDFYNHGWAELMEFPPRELEDYYQRYRDFFERHGCSIEEPLGEFAPQGGLPDAPDTPEALEESVFPFAEAGLADGIYVPAEHVDVRTPEDVDRRSGQ